MEHVDALAFDSPNGTSIFRRNAVTNVLEFSNDNGTTWTTIGSGGSAGSSILDVVKARVLSLLGPTVDSYSFTDFENDQWYAGAISGSGVTPTLTLDAGGVLQLDSSATASSRSTISAHGASTTALALVGNQQTSKWYFRGRIQVATAIDAAASCGIWLSLHDFTNPYVFFGVLGSVSTGFFIGQVVNNAGTTVNTVSAVAIDTAWHTFEAWNDGTTMSFAIDGAVVGTQPATNLGTLTGAPYAWASNGAAAASRKLKLDKLFYFFVGQ